MRDPAGEEEDGIGSCHVGGIEHERVAMHEVAGVVEHHDDHDDPAQKIDRVDAARPSHRDSYVAPEDAGVEARHPAEATFTQIRSGHVAASYAQPP